MVEEVLEKVKERLEPGKTNMDNVEATVRRINKSLDKNDVKAECMIGGSFAKNTHLRGDHDVDLFVRFDKNKYDSGDISDILEDVLPFEVERVNGSRDYFKAERYGNLEFEIVPVLKVSNHEEAKNITDMSPLHVEYIKEQEKKIDNLNEGIRLAKQFAKANRVYGAESYIQGFSGHVVDLLVAYYGGFMKLVKAAADWGDRVVIDMESHWSNPLKELNDSKLESPLVLVDPIQPERNAAAALSKEKFELFKTRCRQFLDSPDEDFFKVKDFSIEDLEDQAGENGLVVVKLWPYKDKEDVMGSKLRQCYEYMFRKLEEREWPIIESDWEFREGEDTGKDSRKLENQPKGFFYFIVDEDAPEFIERKGPPVTKKKDLKKFTDKHSNTYVEGGRVFARIDRKYDSPRDQLEDVVEHKYIERRVKKVKFEV